MNLPELNCTNTLQMGQREPVQCTAISRRESEPNPATTYYTLVWGITSKIIWWHWFYFGDLANLMLNPAQKALSNHQINSPFSNFISTEFSHYTIEVMLWVEEHVS